MESGKAGRGGDECREDDAVAEDTDDAEALLFLLLLW
jgi:hypothetical protein